MAGGSAAEFAGVELFAERDRLQPLPRRQRAVLGQCRAPALPVGRLPCSRGRFASRSAGRETGGLFDPTLGRRIESAGYVGDFELLVARSGAGGAGGPGRWRAVRLSRPLRAPVGVRLDLNGVVKALAVDAALELLSGGRSFRRGATWRRAASYRELPDGDAVLLRAGALATSGTAKRRWLSGGEVQHHLIEPPPDARRTSPWEQVTACGATCLAADAAAKAGFLAGEGGPAWLDARGLPARFLDRGRRGLGQPCLDEQPGGRRVHLTSSPAGLVCGAGRGRRRLRPAERGRDARRHDGRPQELPPVAEVRDRGRPPLRRPARRHVRRHPRAHDRDRLVPAILGRVARDPASSRRTSRSGSRSGSWAPSCCSRSR